MVDTSQSQQRYAAVQRRILLRRQTILDSFYAEKKWERLMSGLYIGLAAICALGVTACLGAMYLIVRRTPARRLDIEA
jgi:hypothetical protein